MGYKIKLLTPILMGIALGMRKFSETQTRRQEDKLQKCLKKKKYAVRLFFEHRTWHGLDIFGTTKSM
jgi:hypothetical protein